MNIPIQAGRFNSNIRYFEIVSLNHIQAFYTQFNSNIRYFEMARQVIHNGIQHGFNSNIRYFEICKTIDLCNGLKSLIVI